MIQITDNVFHTEPQTGQYANYYTANPAVIVANNSLIAVDTGKRVRMRGISGTNPFDQMVAFSDEQDKPFSAVFLTHPHEDHTGYVRALRERFDELAVHAHADVLNERYRCPAVDVNYDREQTVSIDGVDIKIIETPGHSLGDISLLLGNLLLAGDAVQPHGSGYICGEREEVWLPYFNDYDAFLASLQKIKAMSPDEIYTPHLGICGLDAVDVSIEVVKDMKTVAESVAERNPDVRASILAAVVANDIGEKRGVDRGRIDERIFVEGYFHRYEARCIGRIINAFRGVD